MSVRLFRRLLCVLAPVALFVVSCRPPATSEVFIPAPGPYVFTLDMSDSLASYDVAIFTRIDAHEETLAAMGQLPVTAVWTAPDYTMKDDIFGNRYYTFTESFYLPLEGARRSYFSRQVWHSYRKGVRPGIFGDWQLTLSVPDSVQIRGFRGLGVELFRIDDYGSR